MTSHHLEQLESTLQRAIGEVIAAGLGDPRIRGLVSVTAVRVTPDHRTAYVGISVLPEHFERTTLAGLESAAGLIQGKVLKKVKVRAVPHLQFQLDDSLKVQARTLAAINEAVEEDQTRRARRGDDADADGGPAPGAAEETEP